MLLNFTFSVLNLQFNLNRQFSILNTKRICDQNLACNPTVIKYLVFFSFQYTSTFVSLIKKICSQFVALVRKRVTRLTPLISSIFARINDHNNDNRYFGDQNKIFLTHGSNTILLQKLFQQYSNATNKCKFCILYLNLNFQKFTQKNCLRR